MGSWLDGILRVVPSGPEFALFLETALELGTFCRLVEKATAISNNMLSPMGAELQRLTEQLDPMCRGEMCNPFGGYSWNVKVRIGPYRPQ